MGGAFNLLTPQEAPRRSRTPKIQGYPRLITALEEVRKIADRYGIMRARGPAASSESLALIEKMLGEL